MGERGGRNEREVAEEALKESEERYRRLVELSPEAIAVHDGREILFVNPAAARFFGAADPAELVGRPVLGFVHPDARGIVASRVREVLEGGARAPMFEERYLRIDGSVVDAEVAGHLVTYAGKPAVQAVLRDVTERKRAEERLGESEERYRAVVGYAADAVFVHDLQGRFVDANRRACESLGYTRDEILGLSVEDVEMNYVSDNLTEVWERAAPDKPVTVKGVHRRKDGTAFPVEVRVGAIPHEGGRLVVALARDVTERERAEEALKESERRFRQLFEQSVDALFVHDETGRIVDCNAQSCRLLGYSRKELLSLSVRDLPCDVLTEEERALKEREGGTLWQRALAGEPGTFTRSHEERVRSKDGTILPVEVRVGSVDYGGKRMILTSARDITERKRAGQRLEESEQRYRSLYEHNPDAVYSFDLEGNFLSANPACEVVSGYSVEELLRTSFTPLIVPEDVEKAARHFEAAGGGEPQNYEIAIKHKRGHRVELNVTNVPIVVAGEVVGVYGIAKDVTQRKREERVRFELANIVESSDDAIISRTRDGVITSWNRGAEKLYGYAAEEVKGRPGSFLYPSEHPREMEEILDKIRRGESVDHYETVRMTKGGRRMHVSLSVSPIKDAAGNIVGDSGIARDMTERKEAEEALRRSERYFRTVVESLGEGLLITDLDDVVLDANSRMTELTGHTREEMIGRVAYELLLPQESRRSAMERNSRRTRGVSERYELRLLRKDGDAFWGEVHAVPYRDPGTGEVVGMIGAITDVTERKGAEEALKESEEHHRRQARELSLLHHVRTALARELDPAAVFRTVVEAVAETYGYALVSAYLLEDGAEGGTLVLQHQVGYRTVLERVPVSEGVMGRVARTGKPALLEDAHADPEFLDAIQGIVSEVCVPLFDEGKVVGTLNVESTKGVKLAGEDLRLLEAVGEHAGVALGRARLHARVKEAEERYRAMVEGVPTVTYVNAQKPGGTSRTEYVSPQIEAVLGYTPEEYTSDPEFWKTVLHPDDRRRVLAEDVRTGETGEPFRMEFRMIAKDGRTAWLREEGRVVRQERGTRLWHGMMFDITELKRAERALRESEKQYRGLVETVQEGIAFVDAEERITYCNPAYAEIFGLAPRELSGRSLLEFLDEEQKRKAAEQTALRRKGESSSYELPVVAADGRGKILSASGTPITGADGEFRGAVHSIVDVTESKRFEETLKESEERYRAIFERSMDGVFLFDGHTKRVMNANPALGEMLGYAPEELRGTLLHDLIAHDPEEVDRNVRRTLEGGHHFVGDRTYRKKDGSALDVEVLASTIPLQGEKVVCAVVRDVTERKALEERLAHRAFHDTVTGLPNRALFADRLSHALARAERRGGQVAVLFVDLDNFKYVNDTLGHHVGDRLLVRVSGRLRRCLRPEDTAARLGGDEFAALLEGIEEVGEATQVADRMVEALRKPFALEGGQETYVTPSIGIALGAQDKPEDLLRRADVAMYQAKGEGKARHRVFDPGMEARVVKRLELENGLRRALERDELVAHYQPVMRLNTGEVVGFEALVRWEHPERGLVLPEEFVALAEETGLIVPVGRWVLREACRQARAWQERQPGFADPPLVVGVNVSAKQLAQPDLLGDVEAALDEAGLDPGRLILEITEGAVVGDGGSHLGALRGLRGMGVRLALDDFGTGYSSLSYLRRLPVGMLKIDRSFVEGLGRDPEDEALLSGMVGIAHGLGLSVVAEGVETEQQLERLKEYGCDFWQGELSSGPLPGSRLEELLR